MQVQYVLSKDGYNNTATAYDKIQVQLTMANIKGNYTQEGFDFIAEQVAILGAQLGFFK